MSKLPKIIVVLGPTASGKTDLAVFLAKKFNGEIVSADSRQVYKCMNIGTAKPDGVWDRMTADSRLRGNDNIQAVIPLKKGVQSPAHRTADSRLRGNDSGVMDSRPPKKTEIASSLAPRNDKVYIVDGVPHYLLDIIEPDEDFSLVDYKKMAEEKIDDILSRGKLPIIVGGTGLYIWSIVDNLDIPNTAPNKELRAELEKLSLEEMARRLKKEDPETSAKIDVKNPRRVIRALEVALMSKDSFVKQRTKSKPKYEALQIGLNWPREELKERINNRVDEMVKRGLVEEVENIAEMLDSRFRGNDSEGADSRFRGNDSETVVIPLKKGIQWPVAIVDSRLPKKTEIASSPPRRVLAMTGRWHRDCRALTGLAITEIASSLAPRNDNEGADSRFRGNDRGNGDVWKLPSMSGIGYRQMGCYLRGEADLSEAIEMLKNDTRHFAKRQMTWFKRDKKIKWVEKADEGEAQKLVKNFL